MDKKRFRLMFKFWLDVNKPDEYELAETIEDLKQKRTFAQTIRDGIRLICDLREGRLDVLFELFPWAQSKLQPITEPSISTADNSGLQAHLARLEQLILETGAQPISMAPVGDSGAPKAMDVPQFSAPAIDDDEDDLVLEIRKDSSSDAVNNFLNSVMSLQQ